MVEESGENKLAGAVTGVGRGAVSGGVKINSGRATYPAKWCAISEKGLRGSLVDGSGFCQQELIADYPGRGSDLLQPDAALEALASQSRSTLLRSSILNLNGPDHHPIRRFPQG